MNYNVISLLKPVIYFSLIFGNTPVIIANNEFVIKIWTLFYFSSIYVFLTPCYIYSVFKPVVGITNFHYSYYERIPYFSMAANHFLLFSAVFVSQVKNKNDYLTLYTNLVNLVGSIDVSMNFYRAAHFTFLFIFFQMICTMIMAIDYLYLNLDWTDAFYFYFEFNAIAVLAQYMTILMIVKTITLEMNRNIPNLKSISKIKKYIDVHLELCEISLVANSLFYYVFFRVGTIFCAMVFTILKFVTYWFNGTLEMFWLFDALIWIGCDMAGIILMCYVCVIVKNEVRLILL